MITMDKVIQIAIKLALQKADFTTMKTESSNFYQKKKKEGKKK